MENLNLIGLDKEKSGQLADKLNSLLANYQLYYQNLRGFHWNIKGEKFFELHTKFEELYTDAQVKIDDIAERILTLGFTPLHTYSAYLEASQVKEAKNVADGRNAMETIVANLRTIVTLEREALSLASDLNDEGSVTLLSDFISEQEKTLWMFTSWLR